MLKPFWDYVILGQVDGDRGTVIAHGPRVTKSIRNGLRVIFRKCNGIRSDYAGNEIRIVDAADIIATL